MGALVFSLLFGSFTAIFPLQPSYAATVTVPIMLNMASGSDIP